MKPGFWSDGFVAKVGDQREEDGAVDVEGVGEVDKGVYEEAGEGGREEFVEGGNG